MELNAVKDVVETDVLVVGAGPTGLVLAIDLARRGVRALLVEKADALFPGSRGKGLQPRTLEVLDDLGVLPAFLAAGSDYPRMLGWEGAERQGAWDMLERSEPTEQVPYANTLLIGQSRTQELLYGRLRELGGDVVFGAELTGFAQDRGGVDARFADGTAVRARYLVAADGGRSTVRGALGIPMTGERIDPHPMLVADLVLAPGTVVDRDFWHVWPKAADGGVALCPLPGTETFQLIASYADQDAAVDTAPDAVRALLAARTPLAASDVTEVVWASGFRANAAMADRFREGRVLLAGDAAHVHSPAGGQGLNTSVQDAYNLGWKLGAVLRHGAPDALLDSYEAERLPVAADVLGISTRLHRASRGGEGAQRGAEVQQLGLGYRGGPLSAGAAGALVAGDRAPAGRGLFDAYRGPHFTLLAVGTDAALPEVDGELVRVHRIGEYAAYGTGLFLIRPDGYVGWAGEDATGLTEYLTDVLGLGLGPC
ncbi:FAD-dependent monooxygenase [Streptomyces sp. NPDC050504]|uniref:FAD-dependent monooxygenase n=1 Tax=Streptomyces sp. NPDC050504 TaxID=3365618 RepID=UPI0037B56F5D